MRVQYPKCAYGPYRLIKSDKNGVYILVKVSVYITVPCKPLISLSLKVFQKYDRAANFQPNMFWCQKFVEMMF